MPRSLLLAATLAVAAALALAGVVGLVRLVTADGDGEDVAAASPPPPATPTTPAQDGHEVWARQPDGTPVRWDPCSPIEWVLEADGAPPDARALVLRATGIVERASGLSFRFVGTTDEVPSRDRELVVGSGEAAAWAPVLVSWSRPDEVDLPLTDATRGVAVPVAVRDGERRAFATGQVVLNADLTGRLLDGFEDRHASWGATLVHELGHLVGLDHVDDAAQMMFPAPGFGPVELGDGDEAGLAEVGAGGCQPVPPAVDVDATYPTFDGDG